MEGPFFFKVLEIFNFGHQFITWIKLLYKNPSTIIKNNDWLSDRVTLERGSRQGCPVSALLFILIVEILAVKLKKNIMVKIGNISRVQTLSVCR